MSVRQKTYDVIKFNQANVIRCQDALTVEEPLQIFINGKALMATMRTPGDDLALVRGLLFTESIYTAEESLLFKVMETNEEGNVLAMNLVISPSDLGEGYYQKRSMLSVSSCGICGREEIPDIISHKNPLNSTRRFNANSIQGLFKQMEAAQTTFNFTGGSHAAAAFDETGMLLAAREDIGRHNAVDKVVGSLLESGKLPKAAVLLVSGRVSYEIVTKCFLAGIEVLAAVSAPSSLAVSLAEQAGISLFAFCRKSNVNCYSNSWRIDSEMIQVNDQKLKSYV